MGGYKLNKIFEYWNNKNNKKLFLKLLSKVSDFFNIQKSKTFESNVRNNFLLLLNKMKSIRPLSNWYSSDS
jgi:hypothetical protein